MKRLFSSVLMILAVAMFSIPALASGPSVFKKYKCNSCHTVKSKGIKHSGKPEVESPDLSKTGKNGDKRWFAGYLLKKKAKNGKKHEKRWSGSKDDLRVLATWLETLK